MKMKISEKIGLKPLEILVITNHGDFVMDYRDFDKFHEELSVSYGEEGGHFKVLMVIDEHNQKYMGDRIWLTFQRGDIDGCF